MTTNPDHCAYCDAPLPSAQETSGPEHPALPLSSPYCCYGCRLLAQSRTKPLAVFGESKSIWFKVAIGAAIAGQQMVLGLAVNLSPPEGSTRLLLHLALIISSLATCGLLGLPLVSSLAKDLREKRLTIECLFMVGVAGALVASILSTLTGQGAVYYEVTSILLTIYTAGKTLGANCRSKALLEARTFAAFFQTARVLAPDGSTIKKAIQDLSEGEEVQVFAREPIPVDGEIVSGQSYVRDPFFGELHPVVRRGGDQVLAGSYCEDGALTIRAAHGFPRRRLDDLLALLSRAENESSPSQRQADRITSRFLPLVLSLAGATFCYWTFTQGWQTGLFNSMAVLLVACPCAMGLATPVGIWSALGVLASRGLVARSGNLVDLLAEVDCVIFDKTGTLSEDELGLVDVATDGPPARRRQLLDLLRLLNEFSPHPVARAFAFPGAPRIKGECRSIKAIPGAGIEAWIVQESGQEFYLRLGERTLMSSLASEGDLLRTLRSLPGDRLIYLQVDGKLAAIGALREQLRPSAQPAIALLHKAGIETWVFTGDKPARAKELGLLNVIGDLAPDKKLDLVKEKRKWGKKVCFVGDGLNDAAAIQGSFVGLALNQGASVTTAQAHGVIFGSDLFIVPWAINFSGQVRNGIRSNLFFAAVYNLLGMAVAAAGMLHPVAAALLMVVSSSVVSGRAFFTARKMSECCFAPPSPKASAPPAKKQWFGPLLGFSMAVQGPVLVWFGGLSLLPSVLIVLLQLSFGMAIAQFRSNNLEVARYARMSFTMLGLGNWGMLLGWWADSGFRAPLAACACASGNFPSIGIFDLSWMSAGMLACGLPPMLLSSAPPVPVPWRMAAGILSATGMLAGMAGGLILSRTMFAPGFLLDYFSMSAGMLVGMFFGCELGRVLWFWLSPNIKPEIAKA